MPKAEIWTTYPTFRVWPKKTFLGLDRNSAHCVKVPKTIAKAMIEDFELGANQLQSKIQLIIGGESFDAEIRLARINRSKPYQLAPDDLPMRDVIFFQWPKYKSTIQEIRSHLAAAYERIARAKPNDVQSVLFVHVKESTFQLIIEDHRT